MTFENNVAKGEIAHDEQFLLWPQCFQVYLTIKLSFMEIFQVFSIKASVTDVSWIIAGKGETGQNKQILFPVFQLCSEPLLE